MGIDWQVRILKTPSSCTDSRGTGFFHGKPAGFGVLQNGNCAIHFELCLQSS